MENFKAAAHTLAPCTEEGAMSLPRVSGMTFLPESSN